LIVTNHRRILWKFPKVPRVNDLHIQTRALLYFFIVNLFTTICNKNKNSIVIKKNY